MTDEAFIAGVSNGFEYRRIVNLLLVVQIIASWVPRGVVVADSPVAFLDGTDDVAFHNLHVVDVV